MKRLLSLILAFLIITATLSGCAEHGEMSIVYGESKPIELSKEYEALTWESSDPAIAVVEDGTVTGVGPGSAVITATNNSKTVAEYTVTVDIIEISEVFLQTSELTLEIGETSTLSYSLFPTNASAYGLTYTSINPEIATVDQDGILTGESAGKTNIVLSTADGITATCEVTVKEPSAIEQLNEEEARVFQYLTQSGLRSFYNASAVRFRNIYALATADNPSAGFMMVDIQGTNKLGGTIYRYYMLGAPADGNGFILPCKDDYVLDTTTYVEMPRDIVDYAKLNAALDEYWGVTSVTG